MKKKIYNLLKTGKKINSNLFNFYYLPSNEYKVGFIAPSKIGKPVKRNYIKRIIRELWRKNFKTGDFLFVLKKEIMNKNREEIRNELEKVIKLIK